MAESREGQHNFKQNLALYIVLVLKASNLLGIQLVFVGLVLIKFHTVPGSASLQLNFTFYSYLCQLLAVSVVQFSVTQVKFGIFFGFLDLSIVRYLAI